RTVLRSRERSESYELRDHELHVVDGVLVEAHDDGLRFEEVVIDHSVLGQVQTRRWSEISAWRINKAAILHYTARVVHQTAQPAVLSGPDRGSFEALASDASRVSSGPRPRGPGSSAGGDGNR